MKEVGKWGLYNFMKRNQLYSYTNLEKSSIYLEKEHLPYTGNDILYGFALLKPFYRFNFPAGHNSKYIMK